MHMSASFPLLQTGGVCEFIKGWGSVTGGFFSYPPRETGRLATLPPAHALTC